MEHAWPVFEAAWTSISRQLDGLAKLPNVQVHERLTPERSPRAFPTRNGYEPRYSGAESRSNATSPGSQLLLVQPDAVGLVMALMRPQIEELLKAKLEALYKSAEASGTIILPAREQKQALKDARATRLEVERRLCELYWTDKAPATVLNSEVSPAALLGVE